MLKNKNVILIGNPNVGKSTIFNSLTGDNQHIGNWSGKTVESVSLEYIYDKSIIITDLPGIYSLSCADAEEKCSRDYLLQNKNSLVVIIVDANCICKSLRLIEETLNITNNVVVCLNQYKSAVKSGVEIDRNKMSTILGCPVICSEAADKNGIEQIKNTIELQSGLVCAGFQNKIKIDKSEFMKSVVKDNSKDKQEKLDKLFTSKITGIPIMLLILGVLLYITIIGANYPSELLSSLFSFCGAEIKDFMFSIHLSPAIVSLLIDGVYRTVTWVVAVMLPPMAIFFPVFALLENFGYLPRVAFNLDNIFRKADCSGKQALTMCSGFGCNACGVTGCRIISDEKQRLNAIVTNSFVPCNGRFPTLIAIITIFMTSVFNSVFRSLYSALLLTGFIIISIFVSMVVSKLLSMTLLKNDEKEFVMEMPRYKKPKILDTIVKSIKNRAVFVLLRALWAALPAGFLIWVLANINSGGQSLLGNITNAIDPIGNIFGLDGCILIGFLLGFPANEIVIPVILMAYSGESTLVDYSSTQQLGALLISNGWTIKTAICMIVLVLMHYPCATTCITIYKETKSIKWTLLSIVIPTVIGLSICFMINLVF